MLLRLFSNCIQTLNVDLMTTSSEKFEYESAYNLAKYRNNKIIIYSSALNYGEKKENLYLDLVGIKGKTKKNTYKNLNDFLIKYEGTKNIVLFYGYDLLQVINLIYLKKKYKIVLISFIFDTHIGAIEGFRCFKRLAANIYFQAAIELLKLLDGYILFQNAAAKELHLKKPYHVTKPGIESGSISNCVYDRKSNVFTVTYMGSLMSYNGIQAILNSFALSNDAELRLRIFGTGELRQEVTEYTRKDKRVYYGGLIEQKQVKEEMKRTDLLINLRDPNHYVCKFAYPSKLIEYMASGIPVLSSNLNFDDKLKECLYLVENLEPAEIKNKIEFIKNNSIEENSAIAKKAKNYIMNNNSWNKINEELNAFLSNLL